MANFCLRNAIKNYIWKGVQNVYMRRNMIYLLFSLHQSSEKCYRSEQNTVRSFSSISKLN